MAQMFYKDASGTLIPLANAGPRITVSSTAPSTPANGDLWVDLSAMSWTAPTFQNSWVNYGGVLPPAGYCKDPNGVVRLRGVVKNGTAPTIFTLPVGFRPAYRHQTIQSAYPGTSYFQVNTDGTVVSAAYLNGGNNTEVDLSGITFATF